jgi:hypothetical protein
MQYNYAHDNDGAGFLLYTGQQNSVHDNNDVRYNVSEDDGRSQGYGGVVIGGRVYDLDVYNNTIYFPSGTFGTNGAAVYITSIGDRVSIRNNILYTTGGARASSARQRRSISFCSSATTTSPAPAAPSRSAGAARCTPASAAGSHRKPRRSASTWTTTARSTWPR